MYIPATHHLPYQVEISPVADKQSETTQKNPACPITTLFTTIWPKSPICDIPAIPLKVIKQVAEHCLDDFMEMAVVSRLQLKGNSPKHPNALTTTCTNTMIAVSTLLLGVTKTDH